MSVVNNLTNLKNDLSKLANLYQTKLPNLVIVSKYQTQEKIIEAIESGHKLFAENLVQEAVKKWPELKVKYPDIKLQMIGHLQSNKVKIAVELFDVLASIDSLKLAEKVKKEMFKQDKQLEIYLQVNVSDEEQKSGFKLSEISEAIKIIRSEIGLIISGLMCVPSKFENPTPYFAILKEIAKLHNIPICSMGMSNDYEKAIAASTNEVRIGSLIFKDAEKNL